MVSVSALIVYCLAFTESAVPNTVCLCSVHCQIVGRIKM